MVENKDKSKNQFIGEGCVEELNFRINEEEHASRIYKAMSIWFKFKGYDGFASYWMKWSDEELKHSSWACNYLLDLNIKPQIRPIREVENNFSSVRGIVEKTMEEEVRITEQCNKLAERALLKSDMMLFTVATKYVKEQVEEMNKITNILDKLEIYGESNLALIELDEELGKL